MGKRLLFGKRMLRLDFAGWRERRMSGAYRRYYIKPLKDDRNVLAKNIDFLSTILAAAIITAAVNSIFCTNYRDLLYLTIPMLTVEFIVALRLRSSIGSKAAVHKKLWRSGRQCQENIKKIARDGSPDKLLMEILAKIPGFSDVHAIKEEDRDIDTMSIKMRAIYRGQPVAVSCLKGDGDGKTDNTVHIESIIKFKGELQKNNMGAGILAAAATFSSEAKRSSREGKKRIVLIDIYKLVEMARITGHPVFPSAGADAGQKPGGSFAYHRFFSNALARDKAKGYLTAAGVIMALYYLNGPSAGYDMFYIITGVFNMIMAAYCFVSNREDDLAGLIGKR